MMHHGLGDASDSFALPFLDLHYFQNGGGHGLGASEAAAAAAVHAEARQGTALDLARISPAVQTKVIGGRERMHQRGMSAVSPQDLVLNGKDNKRKRASWDGRSR
jgi:hypothetical protein